MTADILADWSNVTILHGAGWVNLIRYTIAIVASLTAILLLKLYFSHRTGRMPFAAGAGAVSTYLAVAWAQIIQIGNGAHELTLFNVTTLAAVAISLYGTLQTMEVALFSRRSPQPSAQEASRSEVDRIGKAVDAIEARGKRDDKRRNDEADADS